VTITTNDDEEVAATVAGDLLVALPGAAPPPLTERRSRGRARRFGAALLWGLVGLAGFLLLWQLGAAKATEIPTPSEGLGRLRELLADPFYDHGPNDKGIGINLWISVLRVGKGFVAAVVVGVPLGLLIGVSKKAWGAINPLVQLFRPVSPLAWFPIWLFAMRDAPKAAVVVIFITALWPIVVNTAAGAATIPVEQRNVAKVFKFGRVAYLRHVLLPNALPSIVTGMRLSMGVAWMVIVAVEMLSGSTGIGAFVWTSYNVSDLNSVVAAIFVIGAVGLVLDHAFLRLYRRLAPEVSS
jgi:nitrate/nitrite transport system permease protein